MIKKISVFITILGLFFVGIPQFNSNAETYEVENLSSPDLIGKEYLGNGEYLVGDRNNIITNYNVYDGNYNVKGDFTVVSAWFLEIPVVKNETYTITYLPILNDGFSGNIYFEWANGGVVAPMSLNSTRTFTIDNINSDHIKVSLNLNGNYDFNFKLQIQKGDTATSYILPFEALKRHIYLEYESGKYLDSDSYFIEWLFNIFYSPIKTLSGSTVNIIDNIINNVGDKSLNKYDINLSLFSETPILSTNGYDLALLFFSVFYSLIFIVIVWKILKKVVVKITRWNKW